MNVITETDRFLKTVAATIDGARLLRPGQRVLVACSGGADSVALLTALTRLAANPQRDYRLTMAHLNHGLREAAADDAAFVADLAHEHELELISGRVNVPAMAEELGEGVEHAAREARYEFLAGAARQCGASAVAVAHHADDNVETVLFRILRGSALRGLAGMPIRRRLCSSIGLPPVSSPSAERHACPAHTGDGRDARDIGGVIEIIRPLLACRQDDILLFLRAGGIRWREDETNEDPAYKRNFIRHELLPTIRWHVNEKVDEALLRLSEFARQADAYITAQADTLLRKAMAESSPASLTISATRLAAAEPIVRTTALRLALERLDAPQRDLSAEHLAELDALVQTPAPAAVNLPGHIQALRKGTQIAISRQ